MPNPDNIVWKDKGRMMTQNLSIDGLTVHNLIDSLLKYPIGAKVVFRNVAEKDMVSIHYETYIDVDQNKSAFVCIGVEEERNEK